MADSRSSSSPTPLTGKPSKNPRQEAAIRFSVTCGQRPYFAARSFKRHLRGYLGARDIAYPDQAQQPVNEQQCFAIALRYYEQRTGQRRPTRNRARKAA
jgi:hypothetical protein